MTLSKQSQTMALEMLEEIERTRSGGLPIDGLEQKLWRLLDGTDETFPVTIASQIDELVQNLRYLRAENRAHPGGVDEDHGGEVIYNEVIAALSRVLR